MSAQSIGALLQSIKEANVNIQGLVAWIGENGLEAFLQRLTDTLGYRGILLFESTAQLSVAGGSDSQYAVAPDPTVAGGYNLFVFSPNIDNTIIGAVTTSSAGQWRPVFATSSTPSGPFTTLTDTGVKYIIPNVSVVAQDAAMTLGDDVKPFRLAILELISTTKGFLVPRMNTAAMNTMLTDPTGADGLMIYNVDSDMVLNYNPVTTNMSGITKRSFSQNLSSVTTLTVTFGGTQHVTSYGVYPSAENAIAAAAFAGAWRISNKTGTTFDIIFASPVTGQCDFTYLIAQ